MSALLLPISAFSKAFDCKGEEGSEGKRGKARESDAAELRRTQPKGSEGRKKVKSEEGRGKREESNSK